MAVDIEFRGKKISSVICSGSVTYLKWINIKYISGWTHIDLTVKDILAKYAQLISKEKYLLPEEINLLNEFEEYYGKVKGYYGKERLIKGFYNMIDNTKSGDANFWVYKI